MVEFFGATKDSYLPEMYVKGTSQKNGRRRKIERSEIDRLEIDR